MSSVSYRNKRKNLMGVSLVIILYKYFKVKPPPEIPVFGFKIPLVESHYFMYILWIMFGYFLYRFIVEWFETERDDFVKSYLSFIWSGLNTYGLKLTQSQVEKPLFLDDSKVLNGLKTHFVNHHFDVERGYNYATFREVPTGKTTVANEQITFKRDWRFNVILLVRFILFFFIKKYSSEYLIPLVLILYTLYYVGLPSFVKLLF